jgi:DNA replication protein DnaC
VRRTQDRVDELKALYPAGHGTMFSNRTLDVIAETATSGQYDFMLGIVRGELEYRDVNRRARLAKSAGFPVRKHFDDSFHWDDIGFPDSYSRKEMLSCGFIKTAENLVLYGGVGTGKTHSAIALGLLACDQGMTVRFYTMSDLVLKLSAARDSGTLDRLLSALTKVDLLEIDEWGYLPTDRDGARLLFQVISRRYETGSVLLTTNLEFSRWGSVFTDDQMAAAMIDRIAHHGRLITYGGESNRMIDALMRR